MCSAAKKNNNLGLINLKGLVDGCNHVSSTGTSQKTHIKINQAIAASKKEKKTQRTNKLLPI